MEDEEQSKQLNEVEIPSDKTSNIPVSSLSLSPTLQICNALMANFWIGPLVVMYWTSVWNLSDSTLIYPDDIHVSTWVSAAIGFSVYFISSCFQKPLYHLSTAFSSRIWIFFVTRSYTYIMAFASVSQWRSIWHVWNLYTSTSTHNALATMFGSFFILILLRCSKQVLASPVIISLDVLPSSFFGASTFFGTKVCTWQHIADSLFTVTAIPILVVTTWRGLWTLMDRELRPDDLTASALYSLLIAYGLEGLLLLTWVPWRKLLTWSYRRHWLLKYLVEGTYTTLHNIATISHWRGFWILYEKDFMDRQLKFWIGHAASFWLLTLTFASRSIMTTSAIKDGESPDGQCIEQDMYHVTHLWRFWQKCPQKQRKITRPQFTTVTTNI